MRLEERAKKVNDGMKEVIGLYAKEMGMDILQNIEPGQLALVQKAMAVMNEGMELQLEQAKVIDGLNMKLDTIIKKLDELNK